LKIDNISQQLKGGADFATVARAKSEDAQSLTRGGDLGFATEDELKQSGFPPELVTRFFTMQVGDVTEPIRSTAVNGTSSNLKRSVCKRRILRWTAPEFVSKLLKP